MREAFGGIDLVLIGLLAVCAVTDVRHGRILNVVTYPAMILGLVAGLLGIDNGSIGTSVLGLLVGGVSLYVFFSFGWMGGGDVKLMAAVGALKGYPFILNAMFYSIFLAGTCAAVLLIWRGQTQAVAGDFFALARRFVGLPAISPQEIPARGGSFPFGAAIAVGTFIAVLIDAFRL